MEANNKKILVLGSGMMVEPLIDYLLKRPENSIIIGTNMKSVAEKLIDKKKENSSRMSSVEIDVVKEEVRLLELVSQCNLVVSYVPPVLHEFVARACLKGKRNMITTSYVSDYLNSLNSAVQESGLIFMNEIGLDPGIDHLITHKVIHEATKRGEKIVHYESWCGALCSPEYLDNPLLYKFTWAPRGALLALRNEAQQWINNTKRQIKSEELLTNTTEKAFHPCFNLEGYFNRDSLPYKTLYDLKDAHTVIRGTIRYQGFAFVFQCFKNLGLFSETKLEDNVLTWRELINNLTDNKLVEKMRKEFKSELKDEILFLYEKEAECNDDKETKFYVDTSLMALAKFNKNYFQSKGFVHLFKKIFASLKYLNLYCENNKLKARNILDAFATMLEEKMKLQEWERDLVFMQNEFKLVGKDGRLINKKYDLVVFGRHNNLPYSAVSLLVSLPCAVTAQLILDGKIKETGVLRPTSEVVISSVLKELEHERIHIMEHFEKKPKF